MVTQDLVGLAEVADLLGVTRQAVANWRGRDTDFPTPAADLKSGPVWQLGDIESWARNNGHEIKVQSEEQDSATQSMKTALTVSVMNMKGGVGKSTVCANLGWGLRRRGLEVLLVDLDPQFNLSQYTLGIDQLEKHLQDEKCTVADIFEQAIHKLRGNDTQVELTPENLITQRNYWGNKIDIIPARLELAWSYEHAKGYEHLLDDFLDTVRDRYDVILMDCPPTEGPATTAAYIASDWILVPVKPDYLSTVGLPLLAESLSRFKELKRDSKLGVLGIVYNATSKHKSEQIRARRFVEEVSKTEGWDIFTHEVSFSESYPRGAREGQPIFRTGYARSGRSVEIDNLTREFAQKVGL